eukprot:6064176-Pleurochrysis_carterae.AAC.1
MNEQLLSPMLELMRLHPASLPQGSSGSVDIVGMDVSRSEAANAPAPTALVRKRKQPVAPIDQHARHSEQSDGGGAPTSVRAGAAWQAPRDAAGGSGSAQ